MLRSQWISPSPGIVLPAAEDRKEKISQQQQQ